MAPRSYEPPSASWCGSPWEGRLRSLRTKRRSPHPRRWSASRRARTSRVLLYFTSRNDGEEAEGAVLHTHQSYPVGHLSHDVLAGPPRRGRASEHQLTGVGQARLVELLRAVERGGDDPGARCAALRREENTGGAASARCDHPLRPAHRVAHAHPRVARGESGGAPRARERRRAAEPRGHRDRAGGLGPHGARRLRADRDDGAGREPARAHRRAGVDGQAAPRLRRGAPRPRRGRDRRRGGGAPPRAATDRA